MKGRRKMLRRKTSLKPKVAVKRVNVARKAKARERAYGPEERRAWIAMQPCLHCQRGPCQNAHVRNGGMGRKADAEWVVPLCAECHDTQHRKGWAGLPGWTQEKAEMWAAIVDARWCQWYANHPTQEVA